MVVVRMLLTALLAVLVGAQALVPQTIDWALLSLPDWARLLGLPLAVLGLGLLFATHRALGLEFSPTLTLRPGHRLVTRGPYRYVRHPMYIAYLFVFSGAGLVAANPLITILGTTVIGLLMSVRLVREEAMLAKAFGDDYYRWAASTPRFVPDIRRRVGVTRTLSVPGEDG